MKESNLENIKFISKVLFDAVPIEDAGYCIVQHPFVSNMFWSDGKDIVVLDNEENIEKCRKYFKDYIDKCKDISGIYIMVNTAWKLTWFKFVESELSDKDFANYLEDAWVAEENPNMDVNVPRKESIEYFKRAKKEYLMTEEDYEYYKNLPEELVVWRGVSPGRCKLGLSWTDDKSKAEWFKNRFGEGYLLEARINKKHVLAYFNSRNEKEVVVDVFRIQKHIKTV